MIVSDFEVMPKTRHVLVIEDDEALGQQLLQHLRGTRLPVRWLRSGRVLAPSDLALAALVVLDLMLPGVYGLDVLKQLRSISDVPVLVLSARNETVDKVRALKLGADDYLTKPFWPEEFVERVRARLRRPVLVECSKGIQVGDLSMQPATRVATLAGHELPLTPIEFTLLLTLAERNGAPVTRRVLLERALESEHEGGERALDAHISRLRKKLGGRRLVETVWGIGYRLAEFETP